MSNNLPPHPPGRQIAQSGMELPHIESRLYQQDQTAHSQICTPQSFHYVLPQASPAVRPDNQSFVHQFRMLA